METSLHRKTPIEQLIWWLDQKIKTHNTEKIRLSLFRGGLEEYLEKERELMRECFYAGKNYYEFDIWFDGDRKQLKNI